MGRGPTSGNRARGGSGSRSRPPASARPISRYVPGISGRPSAAPQHRAGLRGSRHLNAAGPSVTGTSIGDAVAGLLFSLGGYTEYAVASIWDRKPDPVSWLDAPRCPARPGRPSVSCGSSA